MHWKLVKCIKGLKFTSLICEFSCILGFEVTVDHPHTHVVKASTVILAKGDQFFYKSCMLGFQLQEVNDLLFFLEANILWF